MIVVICVLISVALFVIAYCIDDYAHSDLALAMRLFGGFIAGAVVIMLIYAAVNHISAGANIEMNKARYDSLVYQAEAQLYNNDNDLGKKELANQIQEWNEDLASHKKLQRDIWVGIFYPNIFDEFEFIPVDLIQ